MSDMEGDAATDALNDPAADPPAGSGDREQHAHDQRAKPPPMPGIASEPTSEQMELHAEQLHEEHLDRRKAIMALLDEVGDCESALLDVQARISGDAAARGRIDLAQAEAASADCGIAELERELCHLTREHNDRVRLLSSLQAEVEGARARVRLADGSEADGSHLAELLRTIGEREQRLREIEGVLLSGSAEERRALQRQERQLLAERDAIDQRREQYFGSVRAEIDVQRGVAMDALQRLQQLQQRRGELRQLVAVAQERRRHAVSAREQLHMVRSALESDLAASRNAKLRAEAALWSESATADVAQFALSLGPGQPAAQPQPAPPAQAAKAKRKRLKRMEEAMMVLKAAVVCLGSDYAFIGEVLRLAAAPDPNTRGASTFAHAWRYLQEYAAATLGPQPAGERWRDRTGAAELGAWRWPPVPPDAVTPVLAALKQIVVSWDAMTAAAKEAAEEVCGVELSANASRLVSLAEETRIKDAEQRDVDAAAELLSARRARGASASAQP